jgi:nitroreductase
VTDTLEAECGAEDAQIVLERLLAERHSCRAFLPFQVEKGTIEWIFATAQRTASWCNSQPWQVTIVSGPALDRVRASLEEAVESGRERGSDLPFPTEYRGVYGDRRRECGFQLYGSVGISRGDRAGYARQSAQNYRLFEAPHAAILTTDPGLGAYGAVDVGGYVQVLLLAMQAQRVAAIPQAALANYSRQVKAAAQIPEERLLVCTVAFGYEDPDHPVNRFRTSRAPLNDVVTWIDQ